MSQRYVSCFNCNRAVTTLKRLGAMPTLINENQKLPPREKRSEKCLLR